MGQERRARPGDPYSRGKGEARSIRPSHVPSSTGSDRQALLKDEKLARLSPRYQNVPS